MTIYPDLSKFCRLAHEFNIIPVSTVLSVDVETPISIYYKIVKDKQGFILESADTSKNFGRYSFIGTDPFITAAVRSKYSEFITEQESIRVDGAPLETMEKILNEFKFPNLTGMPPFSGGAVGYFAYETVGTWERVRGLNISDDMILGEFLFCQVIIVMDHLTHSAQIIYLARIEDDLDLTVIYEKAVNRLHAVIDMLQEAAHLPSVESKNVETGNQGIIAGADDSNVKHKFMKIVERAKEYIAAGDIFQVVLSQPFHCKLTHHDFALYRKLRRVNPSPYMFYINFGQRRLVGASPEMLVKLDNGRVYTYPIAGTRPRGKNPEEDARLADELLSDDKEKAEHAMLVDLGRNDLGRISIPGTVTVNRMMEIEKFSHVMHMVSEVSGVLNKKFTAMDALAACFPAGTVSGAPKVRAMEIIHEMEKAYRGPYAGAVGYFDFRGNMDTCITIRTLVINGNDVTIQTGAGIVADSVPENEYQEILNKAKVLFEIAVEDDGRDFNY